jgi:hypothetical protein
MYIRNMLQMRILFMGLWHVNARPDRTYNHNHKLVDLLFSYYALPFLTFFFFLPASMLDTAGLALSSFEEIAGDDDKGDGDDASNWPESTGAASGLSFEGVLKEIRGWSAIVRAVSVAGSAEGMLPGTAEIAACSTCTAGEAASAVLAGSLAAEKDSLFTAKRGSIACDRSGEGSFGLDIGIV